MAEIEKLHAVLDVIKQVARSPRSAKTRDTVVAASAASAFPSLYWDQTDWLLPVSQGDGHACGTAMCFAGWALYLDGYTEIDAQATYMSNPDTGDAVSWPVVGDVAQGVLDLTECQADTLFDGFNDIDALERIIGEIADGTLVDYEDF